MDPYDEVAFNRAPHLPSDVAAIRRLLAAVLHRAALDYVNARATANDSRARHLEGWFLGDDAHVDAASKFTYPWICECLDIDPGRFRDKLFDRWRTIARTDVATYDRKLLRKETDHDRVDRQEARLPKGVQRPARRDQAPLAA